MQIAEQSASLPTPADDRAALRNYYFLRAGVAAAWIGAAVTLGKAEPLAAAALLIAYPAWDGLANLIDGARDGGLWRNRTQAINAAVSIATATAVAATIGDMKTVLAIYGAWAILAGLLQLATGARRWRAYGAQWVMVLSGAQSALAGGFFLSRASGAGVPGIADIVPYAAFGAFYFLVSALWLRFRRNR
ncbi:DUF308 domain-containing protein [Sphingomonas psychrotolerans]|uniref:DUF308 domain-containing protein n=1 Tax=Sphingomonas psychrotolerans TaxID=1327635 RepID=A0ABU3N103_9SPHN|nr:DUF308 domain-containing protein [Sphingomonas psychrotolerans]MDT8758163.1 DUF308 domain-containing protein [Sphingomonas psychrotolerans]